MRQVIIIGAGPAGAYLAYLLARKGIDVLLLEKEHFPRQKVCGGGLTLKTVELLADFDLSSVIEDRVTKFVFTHRMTNPISVTLEKPAVYTVSRDRFDYFLVEEARKAGAEIVQGVQVKNVDQSDGQVTVQAGEKEWKGLILAGADGANSIVARNFGLAPGRTLALTMECHLSGAPDILAQYRNMISIDFGLVPSGYAWVFPKADHLSVGVGSLSPKAKGLPRILDRYLDSPALAAINSNRHKRGWPLPINLVLTELSRNRSLVLGDAAGVANGFTGEGIFQALFSAQIAAQVIEEQVHKENPDLQLYTNLINQQMGDNLRSAFRITRLFYRVPGLIHRIFIRNPEMARNLVQVLSGEELFSQFLLECRDNLGPFRPLWTLLEKIGHF